MNESPNSPRSPVKHCSKAGCCNPSNGIEPFDYCADHYRAYMGWLASRDHLESFLTVCVQENAGDLEMPVIEAAPSSSELLGDSDVALAKQARDLAIVGAAMDQIARHADTAIYRRRVHSKERAA